MNKPTSQKLTTIINGIEDGTAAYGGLLDQIKALRDELQKDEAEACRGFKALSNYHEVKVLGVLMTKSNRLTGRSHEQVNGL